MKKKPQNVGALKPIVTAGLMVGKSAGVTASSGNKTQQTTIRHASKHIHPDARRA